MEPPAQSFAHGPTANNPRLVNYLAAGEFTACAHCATKTRRSQPVHCAGDRRFDRAAGISPGFMAETLKNQTKSGLIELPITTRDGEFMAHYSEQGLAGLNFPRAKAASSRAVNAKQIPLTILQWHRTTTAALKKILAGLEPHELPPLDWTGTTDFQKSVWKAMLKIPRGKTRSSGEIAQGIGNPKAVRAVGGRVRGEVRFRSWFRVIGCWRRITRSAGFPADWVGRQVCWSGRGLSFNSNLSVMQMRATEEDLEALVEIWW